MRISLDFETRSDVDLKKSNAYEYARSFHSDLICLAYKIEGEKTKLWHPDLDLPRDLFHAIKEGGNLFAFNAPFEFCIWNFVARSYGFPSLPIEKFFCTMAMALQCGWPGSLEKLAEAMKLPIQKDMTGNRQMLQLSKPRKINPDGSIVWWEKKDVPEKYEATYQYCINDVEVEDLAFERLRPLPESERKVWLLDQKINLRGVAVDVEGAKTTQKLIEENNIHLANQFRKISNGAVVTNSPTQIVNFLESKGMTVGGVTKGEVLEYLSRPDLPNDCRQILELRQEASKSSTAKISAILDRVSPDGRVRMIAQYHGAGTGRWAGRGIQPQNFPRPANGWEQEDTEEFLEVSLYEGAAYIDLFHGSLSNAISNSLRGYIKAEEGKTLIDFDWANIEGRAMAWLANEEWKIQAFIDFDNGTGEDLYKLSYAKAFRLPITQVTKDHRQIGKVLELSMQYQGGVGAFQSMAVNYGVKVTDEKANDLKNAWREVHPNIVKYWYDLQNAAIKAVKNPGTIAVAGPSDHRQIKFKVQGEYLICRLPSGRCLYYVQPGIELKPTPWGDQAQSVAFMTLDSVTRKWKKAHLYGGLIAENITQAVARDILAETLIRLEDNGFPVVMHVHDEIVCEIEEPKNPEERKEKLNRMKQLMTVLPTWAKGLPIAAEGWIGKRYRKD